MRLHRPDRRLVCGLCLAVSLASCGPVRTVDPPPVATAAAASSERLRDVTSLIGDAECDGPGQCRIAGIGAKPCGGPSGYLAWSSKQTDAEALRAAVEAQAQAERDEARSRGLLSDCRMVAPPAVVCRPRAADGRKTCQLGQGGVRSAV